MEKPENSSSHITVAAANTAPLTLANVESLSGGKIKIINEKFSNDYDIIDFDLAITCTPDGVKSLVERHFPVKGPADFASITRELSTLIGIKQYSGNMSLPALATSLGEEKFTTAAIISALKQLRSYPGGFPDYSVILEALWLNHCEEFLLEYKLKKFVSENVSDHA